MTAATAKKPGTPDPTHNIEAVRQAYYDRISKHSMTPLWKVMGDSGARRAGDPLRARGLAL